MLQRSDLASLPNDLVAGVILGAVMVPVGLAFGSLAGAPLAGLLPLKRGWQRAGADKELIFSSVGSAVQGLADQGDRLQSTKHPVEITQIKTG